MTVIEDILEEVREGIISNDKDFGEIQCSPSIWLLTLMDGLGEVASEVVLNEIEALPENMDWDIYRDGLIELATGAVLAVECIDRIEKKDEEEKPVKGGKSNAKSK